MKGKTYFKLIAAATSEKSISLKDSKGNALQCDYIKVQPVEDDSGKYLYATIQSMAGEASPVWTSQTGGGKVGQIIPFSKTESIEFDLYPYTTDEIHIRSDSSTKDVLITYGRLSTHNGDVMKKDHGE